LVQSTGGHDIPIAPGIHGGGGGHDGSFGLVVQSTLHDESSGFLVQSTGGQFSVSGLHGGGLQEGSSLGDQVYTMDRLELLYNPLVV
jgi:hypothetical protein